MHNLNYNREKKIRSLYLELYALTIPTVHPHPPFIPIVALLLSLRMDMAFPSFRLPSLKSCVDQLPSLRLVILLFECSFSKVEDATRSDPTLRTPLSVPGHGQMAYCFLCNRSKNSAFADVPMVYNDDLVEIDPITMQPTGTCLPQNYRCTYTSILIIRT